MATITSRTNAKVKLLRAAAEGHRRLSEGLVAIEGPNLVAEALRSGLTLEAVYVREDAEASLDALDIPRHIETHLLTADVFASAVETQSSQGIAALVRPVTRPIPRVPDALLLLLEGLQDPGNLGTILRSAEAFGATGILTTPGTVDAWNGKALRASAGSVFRLPMEEIEVSGMRARFPGATLFATVPEGGDDPAIADLRSATILAIGNEGSGLSPQLLELTTAKLTIPCPGGVESLNAAVAASVLLYAASQQRARG